MEIYEIEKDWGSLFRKIIIVLQIITIIALLVITRAKANPADKGKYFLMTSTAYSNHPNCIADKWRDGKTATGTKIREGVIAINVDWINDKWVVKSPLRLGQKIYIEGVGNFSVEDTGYFTESNFHFDMWNLDIYKKDYEEAKKWGVRKVKVYILKD